MTSTKTLVLHGAKDLRLETRSISPPTGSEVQVAIRATGLCGSDLHYYSHGRNGDFVVREPMCLGHESSGTVTAVGPDVTSLQVGDRVALEVGLPCRACTLCRTGRYNICTNMKFRSSAKTFPHLDGTLMELTNHPAAMCHKLPESVSFVGGALVEPLAVCLHAIRRSRPPTKAETELVRSLGQESAALIFGAGTIGLLLVAALATSHHFTSIVVADIDPARLQIADSLNLPIQTHLLPTPDPAHDSALQNSQRTAAWLVESHGLAPGFVRVYDCTGAPACVQAGIYAAAPGAVLVMIGMGTPVQTLPVGATALREIDLLGVFRYDGLAYPAAIALMASGKLDFVEKLVTHRVKLEDGDRGFNLAMRKVDEMGRPVVKVVIET